MEVDSFVRKRDSSNARLACLLDLLDWLVGCLPMSDLAIANAEMGSSGDKTLIDWESINCVSGPGC
jgi:hypothetical protein